ncbi:hypothetical protein NA78x_005087 [Anatilimnocola sp. NA78]|uniref:hypothetical protein n=1 Tax=Anatilimnocola sp. NA78 TaxID=3415683 RepID=UPI003CE5ADAA
MNEILNIQNLIVAAIVMSASISLLLRARKYIVPGNSSGCASGCGSCPSRKSETGSSSLLQLNSSLKE